ncbi:VanZ family protein [Marinobacter sediminum]|uniref:VanZ family protein n=1 Tax=Marinobacter sediminum TaxID=256323 RepID=UPI00202DB7D6|nr:VanZ family protein [Marinobacter sediminum]MCM0613542.1 VanZ family protein [Marinobacter sediminum]
MATLKQRVLNLLHLRPLWRIALLISVGAIVFLATTDTPYPIPSAPSDKINHLIAFVELTLLTRLSWPEAKVWWYAPLLLAFGFAIEGVQANLPYRDFSMTDVAADGLGIAIGLLPWPGLRDLGKADLRNSPESM